jgi:hypothetical protein
MTNISETQSATCRKVEKHLINYSAGEVTKASSSTVVGTIMYGTTVWASFAIYGCYLLKVSSYALAIETLANPLMSFSF